MPQFDTTTFIPQLIWLGIAFAMLYVLMAKLALPRIAQVLEERQHKIDESLRKAENLKLEAEAARGACERLIGEARAKAQVALKAVREEAAAEAARQQSNLAGKMMAEIEKGEDRIAKAKTEALAGLHGMAAEVAFAAVERLIGEKPNTELVGATVGRLIKEKA